MNKTYKGARLDLEFYQGKSTVDFEIEVLNDDLSDFDLSTYDDIDFDVHYRQHGDLIVSPTVTTSSNFILLDVTVVQTAALQLREYWYMCYGNLGAEEELICYGIFKVI